MMIVFEDKVKLANHSLKIQNSVYACIQPLRKENFAKACRHLLQTVRVVHRHKRHYSYSSVSDIVSKLFVLPVSVRMQIIIYDQTLFNVLSQIKYKTQ